jgi:iron complex outermembrane receptor protein
MTDSPCAFARLAIVLFLGALGAFAQAPANSGSIEGRVLNATNRQFIKNAQIAIEGARTAVSSNEFGEYRLSDVPAGTVRLRITYGGLDEQTLVVEVGPGAVVQRDITLTRGVPADLREGTVQLDEFKVTAERDLNAASLATNEQHHAANIKTVVAVDAFGDVNEGNAAEALKYLPGVTVNYLASNANTVSVRGFDPIFTTVAVDGARVATASLANASRAVDFFTVNTASVSRIEVTKVPTPDRPADSLGGSVNLISRNAFEYTKPIVQYSLQLNMNSQYRDANPFKQTAGPFNESSHKILPGGSINYTLPLNKTFGIVLSHLTSNQFNVQRRTIPGWTFNGVGTATNPYYRSFTLQDSPAFVRRQTYSVKADWKFAPRHLLSVTAQMNWYKLNFAAHLLNLNVGSTPVSFGPTFTQGALGAGTNNANNAFSSNFGAVNLQANSTREFYQTQSQAILKYRYDGPLWRVEAGASPSNAAVRFRDRKYGHFQNVVTNMVPAGSPAGNVPLAVRFDGVTYPAPGSITVTDATGRVIDYRDQSNYRALTVNSNPANGSAHTRTANIDVSRAFIGLPFPLVVKSGLDFRSDTRDNRRTNELWTVVGPDGIPNSPDDSVTALGLLDTHYINQDNYYGFSNLQFPSVHRAYTVFTANPTWLRRQDVNSETNRIVGSERFKETVSSIYAQAEARLFKNRLRVLGGVRIERTATEGLGNRLESSAVFRKNADGTLFDNDPATAGIQTVRRPEAGAAGSLEELALIRKERGYASDREYDTVHPSLHLTYTPTDHTVARFAFSETIGRPDLSNIIPTANINDVPTGQFPGTITVTDTGLKPWTARNYDLSIEHYFKKGGVMSVGVFRKDIEDFWGNLPAGTAVNQALADEFGLESQYIGYALSSRINVGTARITGIELNYQQALKFEFLPLWAHAFSISANATQLHLQGARDADFGNFQSRARNVGLTYNAHGLRVQVNYNLRGRQRQGSFAGAGLGADAFRFVKQRDYLDLNVEYQLRKNLSLFAVGRNVTNEPQDYEAYGAQTPAYARYNFGEEFGVQFNFGVKGSF